MKSIKFRPLRYVKNKDKIVVSSYMQWRKVMTANYSEFELIINSDHLKMNPEALVYNHKGEELFFYTYNPSEIPVFNWSVLFNLDDISESYSQYGINWNYDSAINYNMKGTDCDGVPTFSHFTIDYVVNNFKRINDFEPLKVKTVVFWFGWFLYRLDKIKIVNN